MSGDTASIGRVAAVRAPGPIARFFDSDLWYSFSRSPVAVISGTIAFICIFGSFFAPWLAPHDPFDLATLSLSNSFIPPWPMHGSNFAFPLGTDNQGRDMLSAIMY
ncbi:MAG: ABC transporter permease, partial [Acetobacteraceae bacterium]